MDWLCYFTLLYICASLENAWLHYSDNIVTLFGYMFIVFSITVCSMDYFLLLTVLNILNLQFYFILLFCFI